MNSYQKLLSKDTCFPNVVLFPIYECFILSDFNRVEVVDDVDFITNPIR